MVRGFMRISMLGLSALLASAAMIGTASAVPNSAPKEKVTSINDYSLEQLVSAISCLPHDTDTQSTSTTATAIKDGVADIEQQHCIKAVADFQVAIDADPKNTNALWRQEIVAFVQAGRTSDAGLSARLFEIAYHDMDLAITADPNNPVFYVMRSSTRQSLILPHLRHKNAFAMGKYIDSETKNSYDDLSSAIKLSPTYGEAYAYRYLVDMRRNDTESANYDIGMANKYNPTAARMVVSMQEAHEQHMAEYNAERARSAMAMANAMVGLSMAAGNQYEMQPIPKP